VPTSSLIQSPQMHRSETRWLGWLLLSFWVHGTLLLLVFLFHDAAPLEPPAPPPRVEVALVDDPTVDRTDLPSVDAPSSSEEPQEVIARLAAQARPLEPTAEPKPVEAKPAEEKAKEEPKPDPEPPQKVDPLPAKELMRLKMVEVNTPATDKPPDNARFLSDKNRRVERETRARDTNLVHDHPKPQPYSEPNPDKGPRPGGKEDRIAEDKDVKAPPNKERKGEEVKPHPLLTMRTPGMKGGREEVKEATAKERSPDGVLREARRQRKGDPRGLGSRLSKLALDHHSLDRIDGKTAEKARELARLSPSQHSGTRGRFDAKWKSIRSALENFVPEVKPGNQTALGTRAHPFALYVARMHRNIHKLWGFGFLEDLDRKPDSNPLNNMKLWTMVEVVLRPDGEVDKATIVRPSGNLPYDVAALDTVFSSGPYGATPREIRSADGKVYLHWRFHRDHRQCGTFGVDPFILTTPPKGPIDTTAAEVKSDPGKRESRGLSPLPRRPARARTHSDDKAVQPTAPTPSTTQASAAAKAAAARRVDARDPAAKGAAERFVQGFRTGSVATMAGACGLPFLAQGRKVASTRAELERMLLDLVREAGRQASTVQISTVMESRAALGHLPPGAEVGTEMLIGHVTLGKAGDVTLLLQRSRGRWTVIGLNR
jgi:hypothetical protein